MQPSKTECQLRPGSRGSPAAFRQRREKQYSAQSRRKPAVTPVQFSNHQKSTSIYWFVYRIERGRSKARQSTTLQEQVGFRHPACCLNAYWTHLRKSEGSWNRPGSLPTWTWIIPLSWCLKIFMYLHPCWSDTFVMVCFAPVLSSCRASGGQPRAGSSWTCPVVLDFTINTWPH